MVLAVNPVWSNSLFHKDIQAGCVGFCSFHKHFFPYYHDMNINTFLTDYKIGNCESSEKKTGKFIGYQALRQHLSCQGDWWHNLVTWFVKSMFDQKPRAYEDDYNNLMPIKDRTESVTDSVQLFNDESESEAGEFIQDFHVKG